MAVRNVCGHDRQEEFESWLYYFLTASLSSSYLIYKEGHGSTYLMEYRSNGSFQTTGVYRPFLLVGKRPDFSPG